MINIFHVLIYLFLFFTFWILIEAQVYRVRRIKVMNSKIPKGFKKFKIIFISDIHYGKTFRSKRLISVVDRINKLEADIIIIGGDYLDISVKSKRDVSVYLDKEFEILRNLKAKLGIYTVLGNHDYYNRKDALLNEISSSSFKLLKNSTEFINFGEDSIKLVGVDDLFEGNPQITMLKENSNKFTIAICHNPDFFSDYKNLINYDLALSGHTHGGQINFFGLYAPYTSSKYGQKYIKKIVHEENRDIVLTRGIGNGMLPIRFFAMPEILEINLE
ncbi:metallophosphoesterase [Clostridium tagluense]|uniref:metallophosphoesterase n=1 Tax=Clostridium tagluense TaxID=360422 RepID=UPI001C6EE74C|nr:metallophosphoesterase [Clostridium tagluense]MBW9157272.1 metallophosphoesterase [Clostridium tagluense]WLC67575.1 metallophosphoesterase [Clostridium tagluense]